MSVANLSAHERFIHLEDAVAEIERLQTEIAQIRSQAGDGIEIQEAEQRGYQRAADEIERLLAALKQFAELDPVEEYSGHRIVEMATDAINQQGTASNDKG